MLPDRRRPIPNLKLLKINKEIWPMIATTVEDSQISAALAWTGSPTLKKQNPWASRPTMGLKNNRNR